MSTSAKLGLLVLLPVVAWCFEASAAERTVCTITVNSPDEREAFRRYLPRDQFQFVELVERGRPDWLASACRQGIRCDVLIVSGHFNGQEFFPDQLDLNEFLPVEEMERASCSNSCSGLFSQLKEVYLFGCRTLNAETIKRTSAEIVHNLVRSGRSEADAERIAHALGESAGESNRDVTRRIFVNVPAIYGFSSTAPVGTTAASLLNRYFQSASNGEVGSGHANRKLLSHFGSTSMSVASGLSGSDPRAAYRGEVCRFVDDQLPATQKLAFIQQILGREPAKARTFLGRIERFFAALPEDERRQPSFVQRLGEIGRDRGARDRYLGFARDADQPSVRARMMGVARTVGWLTPEEYRNELVRMIDGMLAQSSMTTAEVDLICSLNESHELDQQLHRLKPSSIAASRADRAAALACLGSAEDHARMLDVLTSANDEAVRMAEVYFRRRPIRDVSELRVVTTGIASMDATDAQVRALDTLARHHLSDGESLSELARLFALAKSVRVQRAIAGIFVRSDIEAISATELIRVLSQYRLPSPDGRDVIDILIRRLQRGGFVADSSAR